MKNILKNFYCRFNKNYKSEYLLKKEFSYFVSAKRVLDLGCGEGDFVGLDKERIIGVDNNKNSIAICKNKNLRVFYGQATRIPFEKDYFDGVHCSHLIEHLFPKDAHKMLSEVSRILKKGGVFTISTPILWEGFYNDFTHVKPYNPESILRYLLKRGQEKTFSNIKGQFKQVDFYWRYRSFNLLGKMGNLITNYLYQFGFHTATKDAYTLVLKKIL